jgi:uncharacterized protein (DUF885 family)
VGQTELLRLRQQLARRPAPGGGSTVAFNDAVLGAGNLPLAVLARTLGVG